MSGGVDSSVTARLLAERDYDLSAVFMRNWDTRDESGTDQGCQWERDWEDVERVCRSLGIPCKMIDLSKEYWLRIFEPSLQLWESGQTPNPDVWCNRQATEIKFGALLERLTIDTNSNAKSWFATGHYARKSWSIPSPDRGPRPMLLSAKDLIKDQAFYLSSITESGLSRALFPIGDLLKSEVRELARKYKLQTAEREESMGLCFVGERSGRFSNFLSSYIIPKPGPIIDLTNNKQIAEHQGLWNYTIGENARVKGLPKRTFVAHKDPTLNAVFVVPGGNHELLYTDTVLLRNWSWIWEDTPPVGLSRSEGFRGSAKIRHRMPTAPVSVNLCSDTEQSLTLTFPKTHLQKGISPGQTAAIWYGEWCLGCGTIGAGISNSLIEALQQFYRDHTADGVIDPSTSVIQTKAKTRTLGNSSMKDLKGKGTVKENKDGIAVAHVG
ncbi:5-methylaminomethyl-2-thiouridylate-methyltransferase [Marasmius fiardii PR-910]|nr:5-methylaminomethyl-2-thiouridylate-methyltransferase [Marasmius fiardii PR-910]